MKKSIIYNLIGFGLPPLVALFCIPIIIRTFGEQDFGYLSLYWAILFLLKTFDLGLSTGLTKYISRFPNNRKVITSCFFTLALASLVIFITIGLFIIIFKDILPSYISYNYILIVFFSSTILPGNLINFSRGYMEGTNQFKKLNLIRSFFGVLTFVVPAFLGLANTPNLLTVSVLSLAFAKYLESIIYFYKSKSKGFISIKDFSKKSLFLIINYSKWIGLNNVIMPIYNYSDRFIISRILPIDKLVSLVPSSELINKLGIIPLSVGTVLFPSFNEDKKKKFNEYGMYFNSYLVINIFIVYVLLTYSTIFFEFWLGSSVSDTKLQSTIFNLFVVGWFIGSINRIVSIYLQSRNLEKIVTYTVLILLPSYLISLYILLSNFGVISSPFIFFIRNLIIFSIYIISLFLVDKEYDFKPFYFLIFVMALYLATKTSYSFILPTFLILAFFLMMFKHLRIIYSKIVTRRTKQ